MNMKDKIITSFGTATIMLAGSIVSAFAFNDVVISGNGGGSFNEVIIAEECTSVATQVNDTTVEVFAEVNSNSGDNTAMGNMGADVAIGTGNATSELDIVVEGGSNLADAPDCCECVGDCNFVEIKKNGFRTLNSVRLGSSTTTVSTQESDTQVGVMASLRSRTGGNRANFNMGGGEEDPVEINTGNARSSFTLKVRRSVNRLGSFFSY